MLIYNRTDSDFDFTLYMRLNDFQIAMKGGWQRPYRYVDLVSVDFKDKTWGDSLLTIRTQAETIVLKFDYSSEGEIIMMLLNLGRCNNRALYQFLGEDYEQNHYSNDPDLDMDIEDDIDVDELEEIYKKNEFRLNSPSPNYGNSYNQNTWGQAPQGMYQGQPNPYQPGMSSVYAPYPGPMQGPPNNQGYGPYPSQGQYPPNNQGFNAYPGYGQPPQNNPSQRQGPPNNQGYNSNPAYGQPPQNNPGPQGLLSNQNISKTDRVFVLLNGNQTGPFNAATLKSMIKSKQLTLDTYVWIEGLSEWKKAVDVDSIAILFLS